MACEIKLNPMRINAMLGRFQGQILVTGAMQLMMNMKDAESAYQGFDFYQVDMHFSDKQKALRQELRDFVETEVLPNINPYWEKAEFPWEIARKMVNLPIIGGPLFEHGAAGLDFVEMGLGDVRAGQGRWQHQHLLRCAFRFGNGLHRYVG